MSLIKPIPTEYNGVLYRSKLEAKWAAYFTMCGAKFEYEPQGFELGDGIRYLPDFCVHNVYSVHGGCGSQTLENSDVYKDFWFECKGVMSEYDATKIEKFRSAICEEWWEYIEDECDNVVDQVPNICCPFAVLDISPIDMWDFSHGYPYCHCNNDSLNFYHIDMDDYPFAIGKLIDRDGIGLFGGDDNYLRHMDGRSCLFAKQTESMFRWNK